MQRKNLPCNRTLAALLFVPGVVFATANTSAPAADAQSATTAVVAVGISGAFAAGVLAKPSRVTYASALLWSALSVAFELMQVKHHHANNSDGRAALALGLAVVRFSGAAAASRGIRAAR